MNIRSLEISTLSVILLLGLPASANTEVFKCLENGRPVYSQYNSSDSCRSMEISSIPRQNIVSPGAEGFSGQDLDILHNRRKAKAEMDLVSQSVLDQMSPAEREHMVRDAIARGDIVAGMNGEEVVESLGKPTSMEPVPDKSGNEQRWYYWEGSRIKHHLILRNDAVVYYFRPPSGP